MFKLFNLDLTVQGPHWPYPPPKPPSEPNPTSIHGPLLYRDPPSLPEMFKLVHYEARTVGKQACWHPSGMISCTCCKRDDRRITHRSPKPYGISTVFLKNLIQDAFHLFVIFLRKKHVLLQFKKYFIVQIP